ncbi:MAG: nucleotidyl transferase AbiEii/AbiGii toxin family protein [Chloroflexi bacterium]|nr:nucleotidyl transferase AbiEii/AbiGii toxin family protein [Chloroflexota bacterium]
MSKADPANVAASVRQRLLNLSRARGEEFNLVLTRYATERLLYRLAQSPYADRFVLKGALLFALWMERPHRPTRDLDLLGYGDSSREALLGLFREVCGTAVEADGLVFDLDTIRVSEIRAHQEYGGQRVELIAWLGKARIAVQIDVGFGDAVTPAAEEMDYPTLLAMPAPRLRVYPKETVIAEKLQAMVALGILNSRMKDFYDVWMMCRAFAFDGRVLVQAVRSTFERRRTALPATPPVALTTALAQEPDKNVQWQAFLSRNRLDRDGAEFGQVIAELAVFLLPVLAAAARWEAFDYTWPAGGHWQPYP